MNFKLLLLPLALIVELPHALIKGYELGFGNWCFDRKVGDPLGKTWQTREQALVDQEQKFKEKT